MTPMSSDSASNEANLQAQAYVYPPPLAPGATVRPSSGGGSSSTLERLWIAEANAGNSQGELESQMRTREARARKEGQDQGLAQGRTDFEQKLAAAKQPVVQAVHDFAEERATYFHRVEAEV